MPYSCTKHYPHTLGLSACFRQHRATSHCRMLHGYALAFTFVFEADHLDNNGWVVDFGALKPLKEWLTATFDHRLLVAHDDPKRECLDMLIRERLADVLVVERVGCEAFARMAANQCEQLLRTYNICRQQDMHYAQGVPNHHDEATHARLVSVTCAEHEGNSATYVVPKEDEE